MGIYIALSIISISISLVLIWQIRKRFSEKGSYKYFTLVMIAVIIWAIMASLEVASQDQEFKILFSKLQYIGVVSVPILWYFFSYEYAGEVNRLKQKKHIYFWIIPAITLSLVMTNEYHNFIWTNIYPEKQIGNLLIYRYERGFWFPINALYGYSFIFAGLVRIIKTLRKSKTLKDHFIVIIGVSAPVLGNGLYQLRLIDLDYAPATFAFMCICFAWAIISGFFEKKMAVAETIYEHLEEAVLLIDENLNVISVNPYAEKVLKIDNSGEEFPACDLIIWDKLELNLKKEIDEFYEIVLDIDGLKRWFSVHLYSIKHNSKYPGWIISMFDITEKKNYEKELEKGRIAAESANIAKSQFLANISHEIRTPLNGILGFTELLSQTSFNKEQTDLLREINKASNSLYHLVNEILDFSKIEAGKMEFEKIEFSLSEVISSAVSLVAPAALKKGLKISSNIEEGIYDHILGDRIRIMQVLSNLVGNAVKFTENGYISLKVEKLGETSNELYLRFEVIDTGIGISKGAQKKLFELFTQADSSTTRKYGGTGLGLAISRKIIEHLGGKIWIESELGKGSRFIFTANFEKAEVSSDFLSERKNENIKYNNLIDISPDTFNETAASIEKRILVVEDNETNRKLTSLMLKKLGYECDFAVNGQEAVDACCKDTFDLIIMDCQMPVMDGYTATRIIKQQDGLNCATPIIAMTANAMEGDREKCVNAGMDDYITKPVNQKKLLDLIDKWLR